jgi:four helix bundle protein
MRHENTIVYRKCLVLMEITREIIEQFPRGFSFLADQLRRSCTSPARNFAEGYYQDSGRQQRRYFGYAIQSARETSASFDSAHAFRIASEAKLLQGKGLCLEIVKMLSKFPTSSRQQVSETGFTEDRAQEDRVQEDRVQEDRLRVVGGPWEEAGPK